MSKKLLTANAGYWSRYKDELSYEVKIKDIFGQKYVIKVKCNEPIPHKDSKTVVSKGEGERIKKLINDQFNDILKQVTKRAARVVDDFDALEKEAHELTERINKL